MRDLIIAGLISQMNLTGGSNASPMGFLQTPPQDTWEMNIERLAT